MKVKKRHWLWNILAVVTTIVCLSVLVAHYKNWTKIKPDSIKILSGFYSQEIKYADLDSVLMVDKIPPMVRLNGFSALDKEKGIFRAFKDSLTDSKVYVYVDNITHRKIKLVYRDSVNLFINYKDSIDTIEMYKLLEQKLEALKSK